MRVCRNSKFRHTLLSCVRVSKMQGAEIEDEGSVLEYMTKSEIEERHSCGNGATAILLPFLLVSGHQY